MNPLDTFRRQPHMHNCAQAVANCWRSLYQSSDIVADYAPYVGGRAPGGLCGALYAAMQARPDRAEEIEAEFRRRVGATRCHDIKTGTRTPCPVCVSTAHEILERIQG